MGSAVLLYPQVSPFLSVLSSDHDDRWETKEAVSPAPEAPQPTPPEETTTKVGRAVISGQGLWRCSGHSPSPRLSLCSPQPPETPAPADQPPEDEGEVDEGEEDEGEDEEWEDVSEDEEEVEEEEEEVEEEEAAAQDHQPEEAEPTESPRSEQATQEPSRPEDPLPLPQSPSKPSSPFSSPGSHQPVSDWGEEMELNSPRTTHPADALSPGEAWPFGNA